MRGALDRVGRLTLAVGLGPCEVGAVPGLSERYDVRRLLGGGANGVVHEAWDRQLGAVVALKRLRRDGPYDAVKLRREFRQLADVAHPNLVRLHALAQHGDELALVMDVVDGTTLLHHVFGGGAGAPVVPSDGSTWSSGSGPVAAGPAPALDAGALGRLRTALGGLARGLSALHAAGLLHRDVKPSNVMVTAVGQVVLVDFGLVIRPGAVRGLAGTVAYMAPEQVLEEPVGPAADWYAVGAVIFEALTGRPPFVGSTVKVLWEKSAQDAPPVRTLAPAAPADLADLCDALLARDPAARPDGERVCRALGAAPERPERQVSFVGREAELALLSATDRGVVVVRAASGTGKTRLVSEFLARLEDAEVVVSRCYEREQGPYRLVDPLVDALVARVGTLLAVPETLRSAARLFPVVRRVFDGLPTDPPPTEDPLSERRRAAEGLRALLLALAARRRAVVWVDDLQWGDADGARLLADLLADLGDAPVLVILSARSDDPRADDLLEPIVPRVTRTIVLRPLTPTEARALLADALREAPADADVARLHGEAAGSPLLLLEVARAGRTGTLAEGLGQRLRGLDPRVAALLAVVAVAGRPIPAQVALPAARRLAPEAGPGDLTTLGVERLVTTRRGLLECVHDRIRETAAARLPGAELQRVHRALAEQYGPGADPEVLAFHWEGAGERAWGAAAAVAAAERAEKALAFRAAAGFWGWAVRLGAEPRTARIRRGRAMARAGMGDAADALLEAAATADAAERGELEWEAVHELLRRGHYTRATARMPDRFRALGMSWPGGTFARVAEILWNDLAARLPARPRAGDAEAMRICSELAVSVSYADMLLAGVLSSRAIRFAERLGDPGSRALAAAMRASNLSMTGSPEAARAALRRSRELLPADADPVARAKVTLHHGVALAVLGEWPAALAVLGDVIGALGPGGHHYEIGMARSFHVYSLLQAGRVAEYRRARDQVVAEAAERGDKFQEVLFRVSFALQPALLDDDPAAADANLDRADALWTEEGMGTARWYARLARHQVALYRGEHPRVLAELERELPDAVAAGVLRINLNALLTGVVRASAAAPLAATDPGARRVLRAAVAELRASSLTTAAPCASAWEGALREAEGDRSGAIAATERALREDAAAPVAWLGPMLRAQHARLRGEPIDAPLAGLRALGARDPARLARLYCHLPPAG